MPSPTLTKTTLANIALGRIGIGEELTDFDERSVNAVKIRRYWDITRDELLRVKDWNFSKRRVSLSLLADAPAFDYLYAWQLPEDYLRVLEFNCIPSGTGYTNFDIEGDTLVSGRQPFVTLAPPETTPRAHLRYIARVEEPGAWDPNFCQAFSCLLAAAVASMLSSAPGLGLQLRQEAERLVTQAFGPQNNEGRPRAISPLGDGGWWRARLNGAGTGYLYNVPAWMHADAHGVWQNNDCGC